MDLDLGVVGLGYVGLPWCELALKKGLKVYGYDNDRNLIDSLSQGKSSEEFIRGVRSSSLDKHLSSKSFQISSSGEDLSQCKVILICVPTPINSKNQPDLTFVIEACKTIANKIRSGTLVILESTSYPGTTRNIVLPIIAGDKLRLGYDFFLGFSSERIDPDSKGFSLENTNKVFSGLDLESTMLMQNFYSSLLDEAFLFKGSSVEIVEFSKLLENAYRLLNISFINELSMKLSNSEIDLWEAIELAGTKQFGFHKFYPGPGIGGHCIPVDPIYLSNYLETINFKFNPTILETVIKSLGVKEQFISNRFLNSIQNDSKALYDEEVLILGATYKKNVDDFRNSPSIKIINQIKKSVKRIHLYDPYLNNDKNKKLSIVIDSKINIIDKTSISDFRHLPTLLLVGHTVFKEIFQSINFPLIFDTINLLKKKENVIKI